MAYFPGSKIRIPGTSTRTQRMLRMAGKGVATATSVALTAIILEQGGAAIGRMIGTVWVFLRREEEPEVAFPNAAEPKKSRTVDATRAA